MSRSVRPRLATIERRASERTATSLMAFVLHENGSKFPCRVQNVSDGGAMLEFLAGHVVLLSPKFDLVLETSGTRFGVKLIWRRERTVGVLFCG